MKSLKLFLLIVLQTTFQNTSAQSFGGGAVLGFNASQVSGDNLGGYNKAGISGVLCLTT